MDGIYLVSSGMMVKNTPSYVLASGLLEIPKAQFSSLDIVIHNSGGKLLEVEEGDDFEFEYDGNEKVHAKIRKYDLSGHANRDELVSFAKNYPGPLFYIMAILKLELVQEESRKRNF